MTAAEQLVVGMARQYAVGGSGFGFQNMPGRDVIVPLDQRRDWAG
jgi:hypothetical protein